MTTTPKVGDVFLTREVNGSRKDDRIRSRTINNILEDGAGVSVYCLDDVYVHGNDITILSANQCMGKILFTVTILEELTATKHWKDGQLWSLKQSYFL